MKLPAVMSRDIAGDLSRLLRVPKAHYVPDRPEMSRIQNEWACFGTSYDITVMRGIVTA
jgi:hypothetical protein